MSHRDEIIHLLTGRPDGPGAGVAIYRCVEAGIFERTERWHGSGHHVEYTDDDLADIRLAVAFRDIVGIYHWQVEGARLAAAWRSVERWPGVMVRLPSGTWFWHRDARDAARAIVSDGIGLAVVTP